MTAQCSIRAIAFIQIDGALLCQLCVASCAAETQFKSIKIKIKCTKVSVPFHSENWNVKSATHCLFHASFTRVQVRQTRKNRNFMNSLSSSDISTEQNCPFELNSLTIGRKGSRCCDQICVFPISSSSFNLNLLFLCSFPIGQFSRDRRGGVIERENVFRRWWSDACSGCNTQQTTHTHTLC